MSLLINDEETKQLFGSIFRALTKFAIQKKNQPHIEELLKGEAFTLIRRHLPRLTGIAIGITKNNIERVYVDYDTGEILYFSFIKNYGGCIKDEIIDKLNGLVEEMNPNFGNLAFAAQLSSITDNMQGFRVRV